MRNLKWAIITLILFIITANAGQHDTVVYLKWQGSLSPRLVGSSWETGQPALDRLLQEFVINEVRPYFPGDLKSDPRGLRHILELQLPASTDCARFLRSLRALPDVEYAVEKPQRYTSDSPLKQIIRQPDNVPGDPFYGEQYFLPLIDAPAAWDISRGDPGVVVAIVDNGTDWEHPDLDANIWNNSDEVAGNSIDDDGNGFVDDIRGWDFFAGDNNPTPEIPPSSSDRDYHGTHTAGIVGAIMNNGRGCVGIAPSCSVMPVRTGEGNSITYGMEGITYAAHNGADIISLSWGGEGSNAFEEDVIRDAQAQGALIIAAAGNENTSTQHFPAAYDDVIAVANTGADDIRYSYSNYGSWVAISAPGVSVLSLVADGYGYATGTSMSTPLVAGVAGLIKSVHPTWDADQIAAQLLFTADDIDAKNPGYIGQLGSGRVNAYRAIHEDAPSLQIADFSIIETSGNFNGRLDPGENADLIVSLQNNALAIQNIQVALSSSQSALQVVQGSWTITSIDAGETVDNSSQPFEISAASWAQTNTEVDLAVQIQADDFYEINETIPVVIGPTYANHDTGNVVFSITGFGAYGYSHYTRNEYYGQGFHYPAGSSNSLYHGAFMAGVSTERVSDCAYGGDDVLRFDWSTISGGELTLEPGQTADQEGFAIYRDTNPPAEEQVGLQITQRSYAWADDPYDDFVILSFQVQNISGGDLTGLYVGLYMDWDLMSYDQNEADWDADNRLGYIYNQQPLSPDIYVGTSLISHPAASYRVIDSNLFPYPSDIMDDDKYEFMSAGFVQTSSTGPMDQALILAAGPFSLGSGQSEEITFAVLGGDDLTDLKDNAVHAAEIWQSDAPPVQIPVNPEEPAFSITDVYPRPSNGAVVFTFQISDPGAVRFELIDLLGRSIPIWSADHVQAGLHRVSIPEWQGASGIYYLKGYSPRGSAVTRLVWLK